METRGPGGLSRLAAKTVVITGGAGFVGSNLVRRCLGLSAKVVVLDDFSTGSTENLPTAAELAAAGQASALSVVRGSVTDFAMV